MDSSNTLQLDEHLARLLAAYDPGMEGGDGKAPTIGVSPSQPTGAPPGEQQVRPLTGGAANEGSVGELIPDAGRVAIAPAARGPVSTPAPHTGPHRVGRFELRRQLGKGGCGIVFLAYDPKLEREVALKIPRPEMLLSPDARRRLVREALAAAEFDHPNLVPVYETGEIGPVCFIATAFCPGQTLGEWLDKQSFPVPVRQAARLVAIVAEAVQHAHDRGVLHRDLKPNNVILQATRVDPQEQEPPVGSCQLRGENYIPRLVDFGLAKLLERGGPSDTNTRQILGTPKYMAPEQAQARHDDVGPTADVYALGVILYEMLAGRAPYEGASDVEVLRQSIDGNLTNPRHLRNEISRDLEAICLKAMAKLPANRYRTSIDLADDLRRFLDGRPTIARPLNWAGRAVRWLRRNDQIVALVVVTLVAAVLLAVGAWYVRQTRNLKDDQDRTLREQADRNRQDQFREYSRSLSSAFLAWQAGETGNATNSLNSANRIANSTDERPDFVHRFLTGLMSEPRLFIACPSGAVATLAISADGKRIASGHADGSIAIWNRETGAQLGFASTPYASVSRLEFALSGQLLVSIGRGRDGARTLMGWAVTPAGAVEPATGNRRILGREVHCFAVTPDGATAIAGGDNGTVISVDLANPIENRIVPPAAGAAAVTAIALTSDGNYVLTGAGDRYSLRNVSLGTADAVFERSINAPVTSVAIIDNRLLAVATADVALMLDPSIVGPFKLPMHSRVEWIAASGRGHVAMNGPPGSVLLNGSFELITGDAGAVRAGVFSRDGQWFFTGGDDGVIRSWQLPGDQRHRASLLIGNVAALGIAPNSGRIAVATADRRLALRDAAGNEYALSSSPRPLCLLQALDETTARGVYLDGRFAVVCRLTAGAATELLRLEIPNGATAVSAALTTDGARLAVGDSAGRVVVWQLPDRKLLSVIETGTARPIPRVALSPSGQLVAGPTPTGLGIWNVESPTVRVNILAEEQTQFQFLANGDRLASTGRNGVIRIWNGTDGAEEAALYGHDGRVTALAITPDSRTLVSGGATGELKLWDIRTGQLLMSWRRHSQPITMIEIVGDGKMLVTGCASQIAVWDTRE